MSPIRVIAPVGSDLSTAPGRRMAVMATTTARFSSRPPLNPDRSYTLRLTVSLRIGPFKKAACRRIRPAQRALLTSRARHYGKFAVYRLTVYNSGSGHSGLQVRGHASPV